MNSLLKDLCLLLCAFLCFAYADDPASDVKTRDIELQKALNAYKTAQNAESRKKAISVFDEMFDFQAMGKRALPSAVWDKADSKTKDSFVGEFKRMIEYSSVDRLGSFQADSTTYDPAIVENTKATVTSNVWHKGKKSIAQYKLIKTGDQWKSWDLIIDNVSTVRTYKEQFKTLLETKSMTDLIDILKKKADSYSQTDKHN
jgi:phospholipid transport system substrate-binding protein